MRNKGIFNIAAWLIAAAIMNLFGCSAESTKQKAPQSNAPQSPVSTFVGKWELTVASPRGTRTNTLVVNEDLTGTYESRNMQIPITDLKIEGNEISFKIERTFRDRKVVSEFKGKLEGTSLTGQFISPRGSRDVTGRKIEESH